MHPLKRSGDRTPPCGTPWVARIGGQVSCPVSICTRALRTRSIPSAMTVSSCSKDLSAASTASWVTLSKALRKSRKAATGVAARASALADLGGAPVAPGGAVRADLAAWLRPSCSAYICSTQFREDRNPACSGTSTLIPALAMATCGQASTYWPPIPPPCHDPAAGRPPCLGTAVPTAALHSWQKGLPH